MARDLGKIVRQETGIELDVDSLIRGKDFRPYRHVAGYICDMLDHFDIQYNKDGVTESLGLFFTWLKIVDNEIDNGRREGVYYLDLFGRAKVIDNKNYSDAADVLTLALSRIAETRDHHYEMHVKLGDLHDAHVSQSQARNMREYMKSIENLGERSALATLEAAYPYIRESKTFSKFFRRTGIAGMYWDSCVDLRKDYEKGELRFKPSFRDKFRLYNETYRRVGGLVKENPFLLKKAKGFLWPFRKK